MQEQLLQGKHKKTPKSFLLLSLIPPYLLVCYVFCVTTQSLAGALHSTSPLSLFPKQLIPSKLTLDVHLHLSSLIHLNNGKISNTK